MQYGFIYIYIYIYSDAHTVLPISKYSITNFFISTIKLLKNILIPLIIKLILVHVIEMG